MEIRCHGCMQLKENSPICEHCGYDERSQNNSHQLPAGTLVGNQYILGRVLGQGGFGITYIGWDNVLQQRVAVKEYFPSGYAGRDVWHTLNVTSYDNQDAHAFEANKHRFLREAESLAKLWNIPQIVKVLRHFEENGTAYIAMEFAEGEELRRYLQKLGRPMTVEEVMEILGPIMEALVHVHNADLVHRDISPDNIMVLADGSAKLLDFGAARYVENADAEKDRNTSTQAILKHGFAPPEQYRSHGALGPWTDIYAMCATVYFCLSGRIPPESMSRMMEEADLKLDQIPGLTLQQKDALERGMALMPKKRIKTSDELYQALFGEILEARDARKKAALEEQRRAEEARKAEEIRKAEEVRRAEEAKRKEQARLEEEARRKAAAEEKERLRNEAQQRRLEEKQKKQQARKQKKGKPVIFVAVAAAVLAAAVGLGVTMSVKPGSPAESIPQSTAVQAVSQFETTAPETTVPETTLETVPPLLIAEVLEADGLELGYSHRIEILSAHDSGSIRWTSENPEIATVSEDGTVTTVSYGNTSIIAEFDGQTAICQVIVYPQANVNCKYEEYDTSVVITGYSGQLPSNAILPMYINGKPVTTIGKNAFMNCGWLKSILLPEWVDYIDSNAFRGCSNLKSIDLPDSMTSIGSGAFIDCISLKSITIPEGIGTIPESLFWCCDRLESIILPNSLKRIGSNAFFGCNSLTSITIPDGVHTIDYGAFSDCDGLICISLPQSLTSIGDYAFSYCRGLTSITIPEGITQINECAFIECKQLSVVVLPQSLKTIGPDAFQECISLRELTIPPNVYDIHDSSFADCKQLNQVTLPNNRTHLETYFPSGCQFTYYEP